MASHFCLAVLALPVRAVVILGLFSSLAVASPAAAVAPQSPVDIALSSPVIGQGASGVPVSTPGARLSAPRLAPIADPGKVEDQRTAYGRVYRADDDRYVALSSPEPRYYQDAAGQWQSIDPAFRPSPTGMSSSATWCKAGPAPGVRGSPAAANNTGLVWRAVALRALDDAGIATSLAAAVDNPLTLAKQSRSGQSLSYSAGWSDPSISEEISSAPGSLEHALVLAAPPRSKPGRAPRNAGRSGTAPRQRVVGRWSPGQR